MLMIVSADEAVILKAPELKLRMVLDATTWVPDSSVLIPEIPELSSSPQENRPDTAL